MEGPSIGKDDIIQRSARWRKRKAATKPKTETPKHVPEVPM